MNKTSRQKTVAIFYAILAAVFYAVNIPGSKVLLEKVDPMMMAALLYWGAGLGIGILYLLHGRKDTATPKLCKQDLPYTAGMVILDILAPILLMFGLSHTTSSSASLLNNFEIVATSLIALLLFREAVSKRLWLAIFLVTLASSILSVEDFSTLTFSWGSLLVLLATICWGMENNCTRQLAEKSTYQIIIMQGGFSGFGSFFLALGAGSDFPPLETIFPALFLGFVAYGMSIFCYVRAQRTIGAAKTSAYYAIAPFAGAFFSFLFLKEALTLNYLIGLLIMIAGSVLVVADTLSQPQAGEKKQEDASS